MLGELLVFLWLADRKKRRGLQCFSPGNSLHKSAIKHFVAAWKKQALAQSERPWEPMAVSLPPRSAKAFLHEGGQVGRGKTCGEDSSGAGGGTSPRGVAGMTEEAAARSYSPF